MANEKIFEGATIVRAKKLEVLTIALGLVKDLKQLDGVIDIDNGVTKIHTKESPAEGTVYHGTDTAVVRVLGGRVFIDGKYDIYTLAPDKVVNKLKNPVDINKVLTSEQYTQLKPLFDCGFPKAFITPEEEREVIIIKEKGICYNEWDPTTPCSVCPGDVFLVSNKEAQTGYRIGKQEFEETHILL